MVCEWLDESIVLHYRLWQTIERDIQIKDSSSADGSYKF